MTNTILLQCITRTHRVSTSAAKLIMVLFASVFTVNVFAAGNGLLNLNVRQTGIHEVSHSYLVEKGLDLSGEPLANLALLSQGRVVPIELVGSTANPATFGPGAKLRFLGEALDTLYTDTNVYTLTLNRAEQRLIRQESPLNSPSVPYANSYLEVKEYAPQKKYTFASPDQTDPWYAMRVLALGTPASESIEIQLDEYAPGGNNGDSGAKMTVSLWGGSDLPGSSDHHVKVNLNEQTVMDSFFSGFEEKQLSSDVDTLRVGTNYVRLELPLDTGFQYDAVNVNSVSISYPRKFVARENKLTFVSAKARFRVTGFRESSIMVYRKAANGAVTRIANVIQGTRCELSSTSSCSARFGGAGRLSDYYLTTDSAFLTPEVSYLPPVKDISAGAAEYLIITHPDFIASAGEEDLLGSLKAALQESFGSVDVVDVEQIYAQFGAHVFDPQAIRSYIKYARQYRGTEMVLLVGGDIYDYRGFQNQQARSFIPSIYQSTDELMNFAPVDAKYVDFDDDNTPDLPIGRLPIRSMSELKVLLNKRNAYVNREYRNTALFAADVFDDVRQYSFKLDAQSAAQRHFEGWDIKTAFMDDLSAGQARRKIVTQMNNGVSLTSFFGHSSTNQWSFNGLFNGFDAANLGNEGRPTVVTQWGCWNTYYVNPNEDSMGHRFLMEGDRGAVAVLGATTLTSASNEKVLSGMVFERLTEGQSLGDAVLNAKKEYALTNQTSLDVLLGWTVLGFPELTL